LINSSSSKTRKYSCVLILAQNRTRQSSAHARTMSRQTYIDDATMRIEVRCFFFSKPRSRVGNTKWCEGTPAHGTDLANPDHDRRLGFFPPKPFITRFEEGRGNVDQSRVSPMTDLNSFPPPQSFPNPKEPPTRRGLGVHPVPPPTAVRRERDDATPHGVGALISFSVAIPKEKKRGEDSVGRCRSSNGVSGVGSGPHAAERRALSRAVVHNPPPDP
jgi:hypothetical protein